MPAIHDQQAATINETQKPCRHQLASALETRLTENIVIGCSSSEEQHLACVAVLRVLRVSIQHHRPWQYCLAIICVMMSIIVERDSMRNLLAKETPDCADSCTRIQCPRTIVSHSTRQACRPEQAAADASVVRRVFCR
jgi:hypothetical protein